jgi:hypothetical protein
MFLTTKNKQQQKPADLRQKRRIYAFRKGFLNLLTLTGLAGILAVAWILRFEIAAQGIGVTLSDTFDKLIVGKPRYPVEITATPTQMLALGNRIVVKTEQGIEVFNTLGRKVFSKPLGAEHIQAVSAGNHLLLFHQGGYELEVMTGSSTTYKTRLSYPIYTACASKSGAFAYSSATPGYQSTVYVCDIQGREILRWVSAEAVALALDIDDAAEMCVIGSVYSDEGLIASNLVCYDIKDGKELWNARFGGEMLLSAKIIDGQTVFAVTDRAGVYLGAEGQIKSKIEFDDGRLQCFWADDKGNSVFALGDYAADKSTKLIAADSQVAVKAQKDVDYKVTGIYMHQNRILSLSSQGLFDYGAQLEGARSIPIEGLVCAVPLGDVVYVGKKGSLETVALQTGAK